MAPPPDWPRSLVNVQGRSATLRVDGTVDRVRRAVLDTLNGEGWVPIKRFAPRLAFRRRIVGLIPGSSWVEVGLSAEEDGVAVSFTAYRNVGVTEGGAAWQTADRLARAFVSRFQGACP